MEHKEGISRRAFLKTAAAVGAALTIQPTDEQGTSCKCRNKWR